MSDTNETTSTKMPIWVLLAFSAIQKRNHAMILIWSCILFTLYSLPWTSFINNELVTKLFLIEDWSWAVMMIPLCLWYILSLRWMDQNNAWETIE